MYNMGNKQSIHNIDCVLYKYKYRYGRSPIFYYPTNLNGHTIYELNIYLACAINELY